MSEALYKLLCDLYPRPADLRRFIEHGEQGAELVRHLPEEVSIARVADEVVRELERRMLMQDALERAGMEHPNRSADVLRVAQVCGVTLSAARMAGRQPSGRGSGTFGTHTAASPDVAPLRWLHLSDLHVGCRGESAWWHVLDHFWRSVDEHLKVVGAPDLVLLTGDLTFRGVRGEFERFTKFLDRLFTHLPRAADGLPPLVVAVPGNHDLQRPSGPEARRFRILRDYENGRDDEDVAGLLDELWEKHDATFIRPLFANYLEWSDQVLRPQAIRPGVTLKPSFFPGDLFIKLDLPGRFPLALVGLNSAWLQYQGGDFEGKLALPIEQFHAALPHAKGESPLEALSGAHRALLLMHHPRAWLSKPQIKLFDSQVYPGDRFVACLHGHMHEADAVNTTRAGGASRTYHQAPSLFGVENYGKASESREIGYTWATLRDDGELRAWPLKFLRKGDGAEAFDRDPFFHWDQYAGNVLLRPADGRRYVRARAAGGGHGGARPDAADEDGAPHVEVPEPAALLAYRTWHLQQKTGVRLIGVGGGNMQLDLEAIYVPLRARTREHLERHDVGADIPRGASASLRGKVPRVGDAALCEDFEVERLFHGHVPTPHALVLGDPGSGKTTAHRPIRSDDQRATLIPLADDLVEVERFVVDERAQPEVVDEQ